MAIEVRAENTAAAATYRAVSPRWPGLALMLGSGLSNQIGASVAALAFPVLGPVGVVAVRQWVAAAVLLSVGRPELRSFTAAQWRPVLGLAAVFATMNLTLYTAIDRIGLGLAVTLEFLGPLTVALASSRRRTDLGCALAAAAAVVVLTRPRPSTDYLGIGLALLAAVCWGCYILLNRTVGERLPGLQGSAAAAAVSGLLYLPVGAAVLWLHRPTVGALLCALAAGVLSSAVPFLADLLALRQVPARFFGIFMSVNPVFAALIGLFVLGQHLDLASWLAITAIVAANAVAVGTAVTRSGRKAAVNADDFAATRPDPAVLHMDVERYGPLRQE
ncbi:EamA family transporter [Streptomyces inhibens]|uniref:EamA family transporter n=1 Tax=Streptomyces inhibens TaxID=2293571 RepID=UPI00402B00F0